MKSLRMKINTDEIHYDISIKKDVKNELLSYITANYSGRKVVIITDHNLHRLYGHSIIKDIEKSSTVSSVISIEPGEKSKSVETLLDIYGKLAEFNVDRGDVIIAFGGGVVGDIAGFAAATYLRGISYIQFPTSLLAQVDSSVGGKTAIDLPFGKNLVGSFYHPKAVFIDPTLLETLDERFLKDGLAEVVKYGCIKDRDLFEKLMSYKNTNEMLVDMEIIIYTCCNIKKSVVETDEKDIGERMLLNFGHTLGHAIEKYFNYEGYTHGEAVAVGMAAITRKSEELGITDKGTAGKIEEILKTIGLPLALPKMNKNEIINTIKLDKKLSGKNISLIILKRIGEGIISKTDVSELNKYF